MILGVDFLHIANKFIFPICPPLIFTALKQPKQVHKLSLKKKKKILSISSDKERTQRRMLISGLHLFISTG